MNLTFYATDVKVCQDEGVRRSIDKPKEVRRKIIN